MQKINKCLFCGAPKTYWKSDIVIQIGNLEKTVTICPEDRKTHTVQDIYSQITRNILEESERIIDAEIKRASLNVKDLTK